MMGTPEQVIKVPFKTNNFFYTTMIVLPWDRGERPPRSNYIFRVLPGQKGWINQVNTRMIFSFLSLFMMFQIVSDAVCYYA